MKRFLIGSAVLAAALIFFALIKAPAMGKKAGDEIFAGRLPAHVVAGDERLSQISTVPPVAELHPTPVESSAPPPKKYASEAWVYAQEFVKRGLKAPSTADFGGMFSDHQSAEDCCKRQSDDSWRCRGWVDAQNGFGAMLRTNFSVTLKPTDDGAWAATDGPTLIPR